MNILLDAQLPRSLVRSLEELGHQVQHTFDLPDGNRSNKALPKLEEAFANHSLIELGRSSVMIRS